MRLSALVPCGTWICPIAPIVPIPPMPHICNSHAHSQLSALVQKVVPELSPEMLLQSIANSGTAKVEKYEKPLTRKECAEILSVSVNSINRYIKSGHLKAVKISRRLIRITPESVSDLLSNGIPTIEKT